MIRRRINLRPRLSRRFAMALALVLALVFNVAAASQHKVLAGQADAGLLASTSRSGLTGARPRAASSDPREVSLADKVAEMIMVGFDGRSTSAFGVRRLMQTIADHKIGGVILMSHNIGSSASVKALTAALHGAAGEATLLVAVDQEGGRVQRLGPKTGYRSYPSAAQVARTLDLVDARATYRQLARGIGGHGFNVNFGPVVDLQRNNANPVIARLRRSYGEDPDRVAAYAGAFIAAHHDEGLVTAAKHFPGHGSSWTDSHKQFVDLSRTWDEVELEPYRVLSRRGTLDMVMIGHLYHPRFSPRGRMPASLSRLAIEEVLRGRLGFRGVVVTDDLEMAAISDRYSIEESALRAVSAGNDILLFVNGTHNDPRLGDRLHAILMQAVADGRISRERIDQSWRRISAMKARIPRVAIR